MAATIASISDDRRRRGRPSLRAKTRRVRIRVEDLESRFLLSGVETRLADADPLALAAVTARAVQVADASVPGLPSRGVTLSDDQVAAIDAGAAVVEVDGVHDRLENAQGLPDLDRARVFGTLDPGDPADLYRLTVHPGTQSLQVDFQWGATLSSPPARLRLLNGQGEVLGDHPMDPWGASTQFILDEPPASETTLYMAVVRDPDAISADPTLNNPSPAPYDLAIYRQGSDANPEPDNTPTSPGGTGPPGDPGYGSGHFEPPPGTPVPDDAPGAGAPLSDTTPVVIPVSNTVMAPSGVSLPISPSEPASGLLGSHRPAPTYNQRDTADVDLNLVSTPTARRVRSDATPETTTGDAEAEVERSVVDLDATLSIALDALFGTTDAADAAFWRSSIPTEPSAQRAFPIGLSSLAGSVLFGRRELGDQTLGPTVNVASLPPLDSLPRGERASATPARALADRKTPASSLSRDRTLRRWAMAASLFGSAALMFSLYAPDLRTAMNEAQRNQKSRDAKGF